MTTGDVARLDAAGGVTLLVPRAREAEELPARAFDPGALPGVVVSGSRAWREEDHDVFVGCARAPASSWFEGAEQLVFDRANQIAAATIGDVKVLQPARIEHAGLLFTQRFEGASTEYLRGEHVLGFTTSTREAVMCTVVCRGADQLACNVPLVGMELTGALGSPPPPSAWVALAFAAADHPRVAAASGAAFALAIVSFILLRRPKPSPWPKR